MAIDLETGKHICYGLYFGSGCDDCKRNYPHLLARTPEEIARGVRHMERVEAVLTAAIDGGGIDERKARAINDFTLTPVSDLPPTTSVQPPTTSDRPPTASVQPSATARSGKLSLAKLAPGFVQDMLAVPYTAPETTGRWARVRSFFRKPQRQFVIPPGTPSTRLVVPKTEQPWIGDLILPRQPGANRSLMRRLLSRVSRSFQA